MIIIVAIMLIGFGLSISHVHDKNMLIVIFRSTFIGLGIAALSLYPLVFLLEDFGSIGCVLFLSVQLTVCTGMILSRLPPKQVATLVEPISEDADDRTPPEGT